MGYALLPTLRAHLFASVYKTARTITAGTFSGFVADETSWPVQYWYNIAFEGIVIIISILWLDEPGWTRDERRVFPTLPREGIRRKLAIFCFTSPVMPTLSFRQWVSETVLRCYRRLIFRSPPLLHRIL